MHAKLWCPIFLHRKHLMLSLKYRNCWSSFSAADSSLSYYSTSLLWRCATESLWASSTFWIRLLVCVFRIVSEPRTWQVWKWQWADFPWRASSLRTTESPFWTWDNSLSSYSISMILSSSVSLYSYSFMLPLYLQDIHSQCHISSQEMAESNTCIIVYLSRVLMNDSNLKQKSK